MEYEQGAENQPMDGNPCMRGPSESATQIARADCPDLSDPEWEALQRLATVIGEAAEQRDAATATTTTASSGTTPPVQSLKLHVSNYVEKRGNLFSDGLSRTTLPLQLDASSTIRQRLRSPCHALADERAAGRMDAGSQTLRASARTRSSRRS
ncbi:hypothetical protein PC119_g28022 [Phytophthora cactorum]|nr:hypothetical protein PC119_g28022 [Phytophthora cactorum]